MRLSRQSIAIAALAAGCCGLSPELHAIIPQSLSAELKTIAAELDRAASLRDAGNTSAAQSLLQSTVMRLNVAAFGVYARYNALWTEVLGGLQTPEALGACMDEVRLLLGVADQAASLERSLGSAGPLAMAGLLQSQLATTYKSDLQMKKQLLGGAPLLKNKEQVAELLDQGLEPAAVESASAAAAAPAAPAPKGAPDAGASDQAAAQAWELLSAGSAAFDAMRSYRCMLIKQERHGGELELEQSIRYLFRKPFAVRMEWLDGVHQGRVAVYVAGQNEDRMLVQEAAMGGATVRLNPTSTVAMRNQHHPITQSGIGAALETVRENFARGREAGDLGLEMLGERSEQGRKLTGFITTFRSGAQRRYYCAKAEIWIDQTTQLPYAITTYDQDGQIHERYVFSELELNPELGDELFRL